MRGPHNFIRLVRIFATFERTDATKQILAHLNPPKHIKFAVRMLGWPIQWLGVRGDQNQTPIVRAVYALGPAYVKFGQLLSTRSDVVGPEIAEELKELLDRLPAFDMETAKAEVERELGQPLDQVYSDFSKPVAAASIAQVHKATLKDTGETVAVKILRPNIERKFMVDVDAFHFVAGFISTALPSTRRLKPKEVVQHFDMVVREELDLRMEASAASLFAENTKGDEGFKVPKVYWENSGRRVMTSEWIDGPALSDLDALKASGVDLRKLSERVIQSFLGQALRDGFFHGDMHQGNLKLGDNGELVALDFGIMGRLDRHTRRIYAEILMGFIQKNYMRVAEVHFEAGYVSSDQDMEAFAQALRAVGEPIFGHDATQISIARLLTHLFEVTERFGMETRTELILLQRTMVVVEGVGRSIHPEMNMWQVASPVVESYITENLGPKAIAKDLTDTARVLSRLGPRLPELTKKWIRELDNPKEVEPAMDVYSILKWALVASAVFLAGGYFL